MRTSWPIMGPVLLGCLLFLSLDPSAVTASDNTSRLTETLHVENGTVPWRFPPPVGLANPANGGACQAIPVGAGAINPVDNRSDRAREVTREVLADGSQVIVHDERITGPARDSNGDLYHFVYTARLVVNVPAELPAIVRTRMTDSFRLKKGQEILMTVGFDYRWRYPAPNGITLTLGSDGILRDAFPIAPFVFATADGIHPDTANGVTHWQQLRTQGDFLNCDPL